MSERSDWDVAIIGAGAAGLTAGIFAAEAEPDARVALFDGAAKVGAKILVAGGGRCNVTHHAVDSRDYNARTRSFVKNVLASFPAERTVEWMRSLGVTLKREPTGKLFPTTDKARTVLDALLNRLEALGVALHAGRRVTGLERDGDGFVLQTPRGEVRARRVILATGGRSLPKTGSDGGGYALAKSLGHSVVDQHPALVSMTLQQHFFHAALAGISHEAQVVTLADGKPIDRRRGSLLWTHFGLSGPLVMDASRHWLAARHAGRTAGWSLSLLPQETFESLEATFVRMTGDLPRLTVQKLLGEYAAAGASVRPPLPEKVSAAVLAWLKLDPLTPLSHLRRDDRRKLVHALIALPLPVEQERGWNHAEVTAGGVPLAEVAWRTMASRVAFGLHLAGEVLDVDGRIGGFNFQWAWATGFLAGRSSGGASAAAAEQD